MKRTFEAVFFQEDGGWWGYSIDFPGANGQGKTLDKCRKDIVDAVKLLLEYQAEEALKSAPSDAIRETVVME